MPPASPSLRPVAWWLVVCAAMVFAMVILGGATRLTQSGLSMSEWQPLTILPPLTATEWQSEFAHYQLTPEFIKHNAWMAVDDFKGIYWLEYTHRLWGRLLGVVFFVPFAWFVWRGVVDRRMAWKLAGLLVLLGAQGGLGWFMVASGLVDRPNVSHYRLAAHLLTAFAFYGFLVWVACDLFEAGREVQASNDRMLARSALGVVFGVLLLVGAGALVAGLHAGLIYNTFPLMDGQLVPNGLGDLHPWYMNLFENIMTVQFQHRMLAMLLVAAIAGLWWRSQRVSLPRNTQRLAHALLTMVCVQAALGITTLVLVVPIPLALAHQSGALVLFTLAICFAHAVRAPRDLPQASLKPVYVSAAE